MKRKEVTWGQFIDMNIFKSSNSSQKRSGLSAKSLVSLLGDGELDSLALGKGDVGLVALA